MCLELTEWRPTQTALWCGCNGSPGNGWMVVEWHVLCCIFLLRDHTHFVTFGRELTDIERHDDVVGSRPRACGSALEIGQRRGRNTHTSSTYSLLHITTWTGVLWRSGRIADGRMLRRYVWLRNYVVPLKTRRGLVVMRRSRLSIPPLRALGATRSL